MKRLLWVVAPLLIVLSAGVAAAQDHLVCYKVRDPLRLKSAAPTWLDLTGLQFGSEQCKIVGGFRLFCVPVDKTVTAPVERKIAPGTFEPFTPTSMAGLGEQDRLCYKIKCAGNAAPASQIVTDQFATRTVTAPKPFLVCGPAQKLLSSTTSSTATTVPTTSVTSTSSTTSTTQPSCCVAGQFLGLTTQDAAGDGGDVTEFTGAAFAAHPNLFVGGLYFGAGGNSAPLPHQLPDLSVLVAQITSLTGGCAATLGPTTSTMTGSPRNCTAANCLVGPPLPIANANVPGVSMCLVSRLTGAGMTGTSNCCGGSIDVTLPMSTDVFLTADVSPLTGIQPCPLCVFGACSGGINNGMACVPATTTFGGNPAYPTSHDCPPDPMQLVTTLPLAPQLTTGTVSWTGTVATNDVANTTVQQSRTFCGYCRDIDTGIFESPAHHCWQNGMAVNAACAGVYETCEQRTNGAFGPGGAGVKTITAIGTTAPGICGPTTARLATIQCLPPFFEATIDAAYDLPAPAASVVAVTTQACPSANPCP